MRKSKKRSKIAVVIVGIFVAITVLGLLGTLGRTLSVRVPEPEQSDTESVPALPGGSTSGDTSDEQTPEVNPDGSEDDEGAGNNGAQFFPDENEVERDMVARL